MHVSSDGLKQLASVENRRGITRFTDSIYLVYWLVVGGIQLNLCENTHFDDGARD